MIEIRPQAMSLDLGKLNDKLSTKLKAKGISTKAIASQEDETEEPDMANQNIDLPSDPIARATLMAIQAESAEPVKEVEEPNSIKQVSEALRAKGFELSRNDATSYGYEVGNLFRFSIHLDFEHKPFAHVAILMGYGDPQNVGEVGSTFSVDDVTAITDYAASLYNTYKSLRKNIKDINAQDHRL
jgi:hypothetical protein